MIKTENLLTVINSLDNKDSACIVGADIAATKIFASQFKNVVIIDLFKDGIKVFHADLTDFPNTLTIKSPLDYATKGFRSNQFDAIYIADVTSSDMLRYQLTMLGAITNKRIIVPDNTETRAVMEHYDAVAKEGYWLVIGG